MPVPWLDPSTVAFPPVESALEEPNGLLAAGGALCPEWLLQAYRNGIFPWYEDGQPILWWSPEPRLVLFPSRLRISRSLGKLLRKHPYQLYINRNFAAVIQCCGKQRQGSPGTWITTDMARAYSTLHELGYAHSVEVWQDEQLVGGLYGVALGKVFFGESMFSQQANTSKLALVALATQLSAWNFRLIDCQISSAHLLGLGAEEIPRAQFTAMLSEATSSDASQHWPAARNVTAMVHEKS